MTASIKKVLQRNEVIIACLQTHIGTVNQTTIHYQRYHIEMTIKTADKQIK